MIHYASTAKVRASAARKIQEEIGAIRREWWRGAIGFEGEAFEQPQFLTGSTPLFHPAGIPDEDDLFMAFSDAAFILERLLGWSKRFKIKWHLRMNDEDWGSVDPMGLSRPLLDQMEKWARRAGTVSLGKGKWSVSLERRHDLLRRHSGRH